MTEENLYNDENNDVYWVHTDLTLWKRKKDREYIWKGKQMICNTLYSFIFFSSILILCWIKYETVMQRTQEIPPVNVELQSVINLVITRIVM